MTSAANKIVLITGAGGGRQFNNAGIGVAS